MRRMKLAVVAMMGAATLGLSGCATGFPAQVSRFQMMPAPAGQSFFVVPMDPRLSGSLQFQQYGAIVAQAMQAQGYAPATNPQAATLIVNMGYGVDRGTVEYQQDPFAYDSFGSPFGFGGIGAYGGFGRRGGYYSPYYSRFGYGGGFGYRSPFFYGWDDPFWAGRGVTSYTVYKSNLDLDIRRRTDNQSVFEGHAKARSDSDNLNRIVPNLVEAMFTGFPGRNGETVRITVPTARSTDPRYQAPARY